MFDPNNTDFQLHNLALTLSIQSFGSSTEVSDEKLISRAGKFKEFLVPTAVKKK